MTITNGYCTLDELKARLLELLAYTATTISFTASSSTIADSAFGLRAIQAGDVVEVEGSASNDGFYTVATAVGSSSFTVDQALTDEAAGESVTLRRAGDGFDDGALESVIEAASRHIDALTGRQFYTSTSEARVFTADDNYVVFVDDLLSVDSLKTDDDGDRAYSTTWGMDDYDLCPANAAAKGLPYRWIETTPNSDYYFPMARRAVQVTGTWGYSSSVDHRVKEACLLLAARVFKRKDAPFGSAGTPNLGDMRVLFADDTEVKGLLSGLMRDVLP